MSFSIECSSQGYSNDLGASVENAAAHTRNLVQCLLISGRAMPSKPEQIGNVRVCDKGSDWEKGKR